MSCTHHTIHRWHDSSDGTRLLRISLLLACCQQERDYAQAMYSLSCHAINALHATWVEQTHACIGDVMLCLIWQYPLSFCWHSTDSVRQLQHFTAGA